MTTVSNASGAIVAPARIQTFLLNESHAGNKGRAESFGLVANSVEQWRTRSMPRGASRPGRSIASTPELWVRGAAARVPGNGVRDKSEEPWFRPARDLKNERPSSIPPVSERARDHRQAASPTTPRHDSSPPFPGE